MHSDELEHTARIDRRNSVLAKLEGALLAARPETPVEPRKATGLNPYDQGSRSAASRPVDQWGNRKR